MTRFFAGIAAAAWIASSVPAMAQSERPIWLPRAVLPAPPKAEKASSEAPPQLSREAGAGDVSVDSSTFDMFAQMARRFNSLERRLDELAQQNAALSQQLADTRRAMDATSERLGAFMSATERDSSGRTLINLVGNTCAMAHELLVRERTPNIMGIDVGSIEKGKQSGPC